MDRTIHRIPTLADKKFFPELLVNTVIHASYLRCSTNVLHLETDAFSSFHEIYHAATYFVFFVTERINDCIYQMMILRNGVSATFYAKYIEDIKEEILFIDPDDFFQYSVHVAAISASFYQSGIKDAPFLAVNAIKTALNCNILNVGWRRLNSLARRYAALWNTYNKIMLPKSEGGRYARSDDPINLERFLVIDFMKYIPGAEYLHRYLRRNHDFYNTSEKGISDDDRQGGSFIDRKGNFEIQREEIPASCESQTSQQYLRTDRLDELGSETINTSGFLPSTEVVSSVTELQVSQRRISVQQHSLSGTSEFRTLSQGQISGSQKLLSGSELKSHPNSDTSQKEIPHESAKLRMPSASQSFVKVVSSQNNSKSCQLSEGNVKNLLKNLNNMSEALQGNNETHISWGLFLKHHAKQVLGKAATSIESNTSVVPTLRSKHRF